MAEGNSGSRLLRLKQFPITILGSFMMERPVLIGKRTTLIMIFFFKVGLVVGGK